MWSHKILTTPETKLEIKMLSHAGVCILFSWLFFFLSFPFMESELLGCLSLDMSCSLHLSYSPGRRRGLQGTNADSNQAVTCSAARASADTKVLYSHLFLS